MAEPLLIEHAGPVLRLRMNRPHLHNAFDPALIAALTAALRAAGDDTAVRVVVLEGEGASFSAGADLQWMRGMATASEDENRADALALARLMRTLDELPRPTIARVHGPAFGGGVGLVACCDIAIGTPQARFGLTESRLGLLPANMQTLVVPGSGIDLKSFPAKPLPPDDGALSFLMLSRLERRRGVLDYKAAAETLKAQWPSATFQLAGRESDEPDAI